MASGTDDLDAKIAVTAADLGAPAASAHFVGGAAADLGAAITVSAGC